MILERFAIKLMFISFIGFHHLILFVHYFLYYCSSSPLQGAIFHRDAAFLGAVRALEEASASEGVIHCMWYVLCVLRTYAFCVIFIFVGVSIYVKYISERSAFALAMELSFFPSTFTRIRMGVSVLQTILFNRNIDMQDGTDHIFGPYSWKMIALLNKLHIIWVGLDLFCWFRM